MNTLKTYVQASQQNQGRPTYAIAADPDEPFNLERCLDWVRFFYPTVVIEQLSSSSFENARPATDKIFEEFLRHPLVQIFRLGFNEQQAAHFAEAWSRPPLDTTDSPSNFIYLTDERAEEYSAKGEIDFIVPATGCDDMQWVVAQGS